MGYIYITLTVLLSSYGQLILKWRLNSMEIPETWREKFVFLFFAVFDLYIFSGFVAAFLASLTWMAALTKFQLSFAYPFMSLSFIVVMAMSYLLLDESLTLGKVIGCFLIVAGILFLSR